MHKFKITIIIILKSTNVFRWNQVDDRSSSFEAGHYLDTLGFISFILPDSEASSASSPITFNYSFIDANIATLMEITGTTTTTFDTKLGRSLSSTIKQAVDRLGLNRVIGCPTKPLSYQVQSLSLSLLFSYNPLLFSCNLFSYNPRIFSYNRFTCFFTRTTLCSSLITASRVTRLGSRNRTACTSCLSMTSRLGCSGVASPQALGIEHILSPTPGH